MTIKQEVHVKQEMDAEEKLVDESIHLGDYEGLEEREMKTELDGVLMCSGCRSTIRDRYYLLAVEKHWHVNCLCCEECHLHLESELTCFVKDGHIYCRDDYLR